MCFGRLEIGRQFSTSSFSPFLKTEITFAILSFSGKASSSRDVLTIDKNGLYRIADININISVKTVATSGLALFQFLCFKLLCFFSMISCLVFTAFGRELDFFSCFPVVSFITCHACMVSYFYLFNKEAQQFLLGFILTFQTFFVVFIFFFRFSAFPFLKN